MKKIISAFLAMAMIAAFAVSTGAESESAAEVSDAGLQAFIAASEASFKEALALMTSEEELNTRGALIYESSATASIGSYGAYILCQSGVGLAPSVVSTTGYQFLQRDNGIGWVNVTSWISTSYSKPFSMSNGYTVSTSGDYRLLTYFKASSSTSNELYSITSDRIMVTF